MSVEAALGAMGIGAVGSIFNNERNLSYQRDVQDYMKATQERVFAREDNAVQRRVADLKAAGLSPVLAAGSAASASAPIKIDPMHSEDSLGIAGGLNAVAALNQYAMTQSNLQTAEAQRDLLDTQQTLNTAKAFESLAKSDIYDEELKEYRKPGGHRKYDSNLIKTFSAIASKLVDLSKKYPPDLGKDVGPVDIAGANRLSAPFTHLILDAAGVFKKKR